MDWVARILLSFPPCLISCKIPGEYRDIEISILNAQSGTIYIIRLPDEKQIHSEYFDMDYIPEGIVHISRIPDGKYKLQVIADGELREEIFEYSGRKGLMVDLKKKMLLIERFE